MTERTEIYYAAKRVGDIVFAPDYNEGEWYVYFHNLRKRCSNKSTATAWANYLQRRFGSWSEHRIAIGKVVD